jgi:hypothetical protein
MTKVRRDLWQPEHMIHQGFPAVFFSIGLKPFSLDQVPPMRHFPTSFEHHLPSQIEC